MHKPGHSSSPLPLITPRKCSRASLPLDLTPPVTQPPLKPTLSWATALDSALLLCSALLRPQLQRWLLRWESRHRSCWSRAGVGLEGDQRLFSGSISLRNVCASLQRFPRANTGQWLPCSSKGRPPAPSLAAAVPRAAKCSPSGVDLLGCDTPELG